MRKHRGILESSLYIILCAGALNACRSDDPITAATYANDYRIRHPIALTYAPVTLDLFFDKQNGSLDSRQENELRQFAHEYRTSGRGPLAVLVPTDAELYSSRKDWLIGNLNRLGVSRKYISIDRYSATASTVASPVRLMFTKMQAKVTNECGNWQQDIGAIQVNMANWENKPWYNMGCAFQTQFAAQVADPIDLVRPQAEARSDTLKRMQAFERLRNGNDPSTSWTGGDASVSGN